MPRPGRPRRGLGEINGRSTASIRPGRGSLGKLHPRRLPALHQSLSELSQRSERTLTALDDNLAALKDTWPLSRYFERRAYVDRERAVFQPGSSRNSRSLATDDLFDSGRALLTPAGQARLDEIARWCRYAGRPNSQIVIAAFTDDLSDRERAEILTQEQADSVRKYLVDKHAVQSAGWFRSRKVAAVGFGTHVPPTQDPLPPGSPPPPHRDHPVHTADVTRYVWTKKVSGTKSAVLRYFVERKVPRVIGGW